MQGETEHQMVSAVVAQMRAFALGESGLAADGMWIRQRGEMLLRPRGRPMHFTAMQRFDTRTPGFRWTARFRLAGVLPLTVVDAFEGRRGFLEVRPFGIRIRRAEGPELDEGEAQRLLAELPFCPPALGHPALQWSSVEGSNVEVALGAAKVTLETDGDGRVLRARALRLAQVDGGFERRGWRGEFGAYREFGGMRLPSSARVSWELADGPFEYFRCEIVDAGVEWPLGATSAGWSHSRWSGTGGRPRRGHRGR